MDKTAMKNNKLLLVEDQMIIALGQSVMLQNNGYSVVHAPSGESALDIVMSDPSINLILMDIDLGEGMSGSDAAKKILQIKTLPIVFLTSHSESDMVDKVRSITRYGYVIKDSGAFVLLSSIEMAFELFNAHRKIQDKIREIDEKEKTFVKIFHTNSVLMALCSIDDGTFIEVNETFLNKLRYTRDEIIGRKLEFVTDKESIEKALSHFKRSGSHNQFENRVYTRTGQAIEGLCSVDYIDMNGRRCLLLSMIDITENKLAREEIQKSEAHYHLLADHMSDAVWLMDMNLNTTYCSPSAVKMRGYTIDEIMSIPLNEQITAESLNGALSVFVKERDKANDDSDYSFVRSLNIEYYRKDGTTFWAENTFTLIRDKDGNPESILGEGRDITEKKLAEERIKSLLSEKELLLKEVHHRMKNNMNTIASLLYLQGNSQDNEAASSALKEAYSRVQSMMLIYDKLSRSDHFVEISSREYLTDLIKTIRSAVNPSSAVQITAEIEDCQMNSSILFPLGIIINELLINAFKHAFPEGSGGVVSIILVKSRGGFVIEFKDNGISIPESVIAGESTGFGITLVKILVQQIKGSLQMLQDNGTQYIIEFNIQPGIV